jgi:quinol monooxygenase YgiN
MERELIVKWIIKEDKTPEVLTLLAEVAAKSQAEPGNLLYAAYQSETSPNEIILHERYASEAALEAHKNSGHYQAIVAGKIIPNLITRELVFVKKIL